MFGFFEAVPASGDETFCRWVIGGLAAFSAAGAVGAVSWIKSILKELSEEKTGRYNDLKEHYEKVIDD
jgi:hypothetical protein